MKQRRRKMQTATEVYKKVKETAETHKNDSVQDCTKMKVNQIARQGDLYIQKTGNVTGLKEKTVTTNQLVPGQTMGSRHCLDSLQGIKFYTSSRSSALMGDTLEATRAFQVNHPEHGDIKFSAGCYRIGYQKDHAAEEKRRLD